MGDKEKVRRYTRGVRGGRRFRGGVRKGMVGRTCSCFPIRTIVKAGQRPGHWCSPPRAAAHTQRWRKGRTTNILAGVEVQVEKVEVVIVLFLSIFTLLVALSIYLYFACFPSFYFSIFFIQKIK